MATAETQLAMLTEEEMLAAVAAAPSPGSGDEDAAPAKKDKKDKKKKDKKEKKKSKKRDRSPKRSKYIDDAAGSGSEVDYSDEDGDLGMGADPRDGDVDGEDRSYLDNYKQRRDFFGLEGEQDMSAEEQAKLLEERYKTMASQRSNRTQTQRRPAAAAAAASSGIGHGHSESLHARTMTSSERFSAALLPRPNDPKVFSVKVRSGMARTVVARIVNKCHSYFHGKNDQNVRQDLGIISVFSVDHVKEYIYLESYRQRFVEIALTGLEHVFRYRIAQVDPKDLMQLMQRQTKKREELRVGEFVRVRHPQYAGDVAMVMGVRNQATEATLQLVPREDFVQKPFAPRKGKKGMPKLPQRMFVPELAIGAAPLDSGDWRWGELKFDDKGYLLLESSVRRIFFGSKCAPPTVEELVEFYQNDRKQIDQAIAATTSTREPPSVSLGEYVRVVEGQLKGVVAKIQDLQVSVGRAVLLAQGPQGDTTVTVDLHDVVKYFQDGAHVRVVKGTHAGESGTVVHTKDRSVVLFTDRGATELVTLSDDCVASALTAQGAHAVGGHRLFDLVMLNDDTIGCIVNLGVGRSVSVLTEANVVVSVQLSHIGQTLRNKAHATDPFLNVIGERDVILVGKTGVSPLYINKKARVEHIYKQTLFVVSDQVRDNAGMFTVNVKSVTKVGGTKKFKARSKLVQDTYPQKQPQNAAIADVSPGVPLRDLSAVPSTVGHEHDDDFIANPDAFE